MQKLLSGVMILDLSRYMAGPYGTMILGDLGAEVIKIETPRGGDPTRTLSQVEFKGERSTFLGLNRSKKSLTLDQVVSDPQVKARRMVVELEHPVCGPYRAFGNPIKCSTLPDGDFAPPPTLGQHTEEILSGLLEYSPEEIARLKREKII